MSRCRRHRTDPVYDYCTSSEPFCTKYDCDCFSEKAPEAREIMVAKKMEKRQAEIGRMEADIERRHALINKPGTTKRQKDNYQSGIGGLEGKIAKLETPPNQYSFKTGNVMVAIYGNFPQCCSYDAVRAERLDKCERTAKGFDESLRPEICACTADTLAEIWVGVTYEGQTLYNLGSKLYKETLATSKAGLQS